MKKNEEDCCNKKCTNIIGDSLLFGRIVNILRLIMFLEWNYGGVCLSSRVIRKIFSSFDKNILIMAISNNGSFLHFFIWHQCDIAYG